MEQSDPLCGFKYLIEKHGFMPSFHDGMISGVFLSDTLACLTIIYEDCTAETVAQYDGDRAAPTLFFKASIVVENPSLVILPIKSSDDWIYRSSFMGDEETGECLVKLVLCSGPGVTIAGSGMHLKWLTEMTEEDWTAARSKNIELDIALLYPSRNFKSISQF